MRGLYLGISALLLAGNRTCTRMDHLHCGLDAEESGRRWVQPLVLRANHLGKYCSSGSAQTLLFELSTSPYQRAELASGHASMFG